MYTTCNKEEIVKHWRWKGSWPYSNDKVFGNLFKERTHHKLRHLHIINWKKAAGIKFPNVKTILTLICLRTKYDNKIWN